MYAPNLRRTNRLTSIMSKQKERKVERERVRKEVDTGGVKKHFCSSECPESKVFTEEQYQLKEIQRKINLTL